MKYSAAEYEAFALKAVDLIANGPSAQSGAPVILAGAQVYAILALAAAVANA